MEVFGIPWVESIQESAEQVARKHEVSDDIFKCLRPYTIDEKYVVWQFVRHTKIVTTKSGDRYYHAFEPDEALRAMPSGAYLYLWAEVYALASVLLNEPLSSASQHVLYRELEKKLALAEVNSNRAKKRTGPKYELGLQNVICSIIESNMAGGKKFTFNEFCTWLSDEADELETTEPDCDELTFHEGAGEYAEKSNGEKEKDFISWINSKGKENTLSISSLKPYFTRAKKSLST